MAKTKSAFPYDLDFTKVDFRKNPELYVIGRGEQGVLLVEPYKSEILPHWRFRTPQIAYESAETIWKLFVQYRDAEDFVGMEMARKFLEWGLRAPGGTRTTDRVASTTNKPAKPCL